MLANRIYTEVREQLTEIKKDIFEKMNVNKPMDELTNEQKLEFKLSSRCSICGKKFEPDDDRKFQKQSLQSTARSFLIVKKSKDPGLFFFFSACCWALPKKTCFDPGLDMKG